MSEYMPDRRMLERMSKYIPHGMPERISEYVPEVCVWLHTWNLNSCLKCHGGDHSK